MTKRYASLHVAVIGTSLLTLLGVLTMADPPQETLKWPKAAQAATVRAIPTRRPVYTLKPTSLERQADRLKRRIETRFGMETDTLALVRAIDERNRMTGKALTVTFLPDQRGTFEEKYLQPWTLSPQAYGGLMTFVPDGVRPHFAIEQSWIAEMLAWQAPQGLYAPSHTGVSSLTKEGNVVRTQSQMFAHAGFSMEPVQAAHAIQSAMEEGKADVTIPVAYTKPEAYVISGSTALELSLLASGRSDFSGSPLGREANVKKAINERITNILIPPRSNFSFNDALGPIAQEKGWHEALGIFNGGELRAVRGGGICQAATTVYRAAMLAGLPIVERRSHSLYVTYYKKYGLGIDATVYPGEQDLVFQNDTDHPLFLQSQIEGKEVVVNIYGVPDGRTVDVTGPYFASTAPEDLLVDGKRKLARNEIAWVRTVTTGTNTRKEVLVSTYTGGLPKTLAKETPPATAYALQ